MSLELDNDGGSNSFKVDTYMPQDTAERVENIGVAKANLSSW